MISVVIQWNGHANLAIKMNKNVIINIMIEHNGKIIEKLIIGRIECRLTPPVHDH